MGQKAKKKNIKPLEVTFTTFDLDAAKKDGRLTIIPPEEIKKEVSPDNMTLREMRQIVGSGGVTGRHVDGDNEARPIEETAIFNIEKKKKSHKKSPESS